MKDAQHRSPFAAFHSPFHLSISFLLIILLALVMLLPGAAQAQDGPHARTLARLNLRSGPGPAHAALTVLPPGTEVTLEARSEDLAWVLGRTLDGAWRGWLAQEYLEFLPGVDPAAFPVSGEIVAQGAPTPAEPTPAPAAPAVPPPGGVNAFASYALNVRRGPDASHAALGQVPAGTGLVLEARSADLAWVLARTPDGALRGWVASLYVEFAGVGMWNLPFSAEIITANSPAPASPSGESASGATPAPVALVDLDTVFNTPLPANVIRRSREIFALGQAAGHKPNAFILIGDSTSAGNAYTLPMFYAFAHGSYSLGRFGYLQSTINFFKETNSFGSGFMTSFPGYTTYSVLDPGLANPQICEDGESPLVCEIRTRGPSVAVIYIGFGDMAFSTADAYCAYLDFIVNILEHNGVIPVLTTLTASEWTLAASRYVESHAQMNACIRDLASGHELPLIDLHLAAHGLPNQGCIEEGIHLSYRVDGVISFNGDERIYGKDLRELLTLLTLDDLRRNVLTQ